MKKEEKVERNLVANVRNDMILTFQGYATALHEYTCTRCGSTYERTG